MNEEWKPVVGFEDYYEVSNHGRVRSLDRVVKTSRGQGYRTQKGKLITGRLVGKYLQVVFRIRGLSIRRYDYIHRLVMQAFIGECPEGMEVRHLDGNAQNNNLDNLAYSTHKVNIGDKVEHGTLINGEKHYNATLTNDNVLDIRRLWSFDFSCKEIADYFGLTYHHCHKIISRRIWSHI